MACCPPDPNKGIKKMDLSAPLLRFQAELLSDLERIRIANENRLRQLTRTDADKDEETRGFGLPEDHHSVVQLRAIVDGTTELEKIAEKTLRAELRLHPMYPWIKEQKGIGDKQGARLLASVGDPYWHAAEDRPRLVSELWQYAGHGDPLRSRRKRGQQVQYSPDAKMRLYLVSLSCMKSGGPWREVYDFRRKATADRIHTLPCVRCGPSGHPAQPGSPWSAGHQMADALRIAGKEILRAMYVEAKKLHDS